MVKLGFHRRIRFVGGKGCHFRRITQLAAANADAQFLLDLAQEAGFRVFAVIDLAAGLKEYLAAALAHEKETARFIADNGC
ncbi:hypothetical protein BFJ60_08830 [Brucella abortus]|nr:hypothetical protein BFJ60_08830 [Brucella abortus]OHX95281.1 hypothetical protein BFJ61_10270 [Brucella abortus]